MTSEDADRPPEAERPQIAEKVKFWEEQDRINQELIPRVLKQHELLASHIRTHETASVNLASLESRMLEGLREAKSQVAQQLDEQVASLEERLTASIIEGRQAAKEMAQQLDERTASLEERLTASISEGRQAAKEITEHIALLETRMTASIESARRRASVISGVSLAVAVAAVVLALIL